MKKFVVFYRFVFMEMVIYLCLCFDESNVVYGCYYCLFYKFMVDVLSE